MSVIYEAPAASAYHNPPTEVWSATLTAGATGGCYNSYGSSACNSTSVLTDDDFTYGGVNYAITSLAAVNGALGISLDKAIPEGIRSDGTLYVDGSPFRFLGAVFGAGNTVTTWDPSGLNWFAGDTIQLSLTVQTLLDCEKLPAGYSIVLAGVGDAADGTLCSNSDSYYLDVSLRDQNGAPVNPDKDVCVLVERMSGPANIATEIGLPRENYITANTPSVTFLMNVDSDLPAHNLDGGPVTIVARTGALSDTFDLTVVHDTGAESCPAPSTPTTRSTPGTGTGGTGGTTPGTGGTGGTTPGTGGTGGTTPGTGGTGGTTPGTGGTGSTPTTPSSGGTSFVPFIGDTTSPTIISMSTTGSATRTMGEGWPLLFNITFNKPVTGLDPTDFVLAYGNDTFPVSANAASINATIYPDQVIPHGEEAEFVIEVEPTAAHDGATISGGTVRFDIEHLSTHFLEVRLTAPDCRSTLVHNQTLLLRSELAEPRTIEPLAGNPAEGTWALSVRNHAGYYSAMAHLYGLSLNVGPTIVINGTGSNYLVAVSAATAGNLTLALADDHDIADASGNRLAGGIPAGVNNTYVLAEPPRRTCP